MDSINYTTFRKELSKVIDRVNDDHCPILITRQKGAPAVLMSLEDFKSYEATAYLLRSPRNAERLNAAIAELEAGKGTERELVNAGAGTGLAVSARSIAWFTGPREINC